MIQTAATAQSPRRASPPLDEIEKNALEFIDFNTLEVLGKRPEPSRHGRTLRNQQQQVDTQDAKLGTTEFMTSYKQPQDESMIGDSANGTQRSGLAALGYNNLRYDRKVMIN